MMSNEVIISPSILSADFARLGQACHDVLEAGADWIHFDVMDNHFVPNLTIGPMVCQALRNYGINAPIDVHLMVDLQNDIIERFAQAGASLITIHAEREVHLDRCIAQIKACGLKAGLALNPATPPDILTHLIHQLDLVLIMSVNPGFGGQQFIPGMVSKIARVKQLIDAQDHPIHLQVDGGIKPETIGAAAAAGADNFVAGSAIFNHQNYQQAIAALRAAAKRA